MSNLIRNRASVVGFAIGLLLAGALTSTRAEDKPAKVPTSHYVDREKHFAIDIPLTWEIRFSEEPGTRYMFETGGKFSPNTQQPEFIVTAAGPDANDESLKSLDKLAAQVKKKITDGGGDAKLEKDKEQKLDGEKAISFTCSKT